MAELDDAIDKISQSIATTGALTCEASRRYDEMFQTFRRELEHALDAQPTVADAARLAMSMVDTASKAIASSFPNPQHHDCCDQCSACCNLFVSVPPGVTSLIADHIRKTFDHREQTDLLARLKNAAAIIEQSKTTAEVRVRCPLLGEDNRCSIYDVRPLSCRAFTSSDAGRCHRMVFGDDSERATTIDQDPGHYRLHIEATDALQQTASRRNLNPRQKGFVHALLDQLDPAIKSPSV